MMMSELGEDNVFGPPQPVGYTREAVRIDRRRLEKLQGHDTTGFDLPGFYVGEQSSQNAHQIIRNVMSETDTEIVWCDQMRSRRDPTILIYGEASRVKEAKDRINSVFNPRQDRVILKLDVSFDAHSHIIGRGGRSIQRVMDSTSTHVHFPDSNRLVPCTKIVMYKFLFQDVDVREEQPRQHCRNCVGGGESSLSSSGSHATDDKLRVASHCHQPQSTRYQLCFLPNAAEKLFNFGQHSARPGLWRVFRLW